MHVYVEPPPTLQFSKPVMLPFEYLSKSPAGWCRLDTAVPTETGVLVQPAKATPAGGVSFSLMKEVSVLAEAYSKVAPL